MKDIPSIGAIRKKGDEYLVFGKTNLTRAEGLY